MYEVSRALQSCEGTLLVVDAAQGIEAQTMANVYMALDADLEIIPVINKIDLPSAEPDRVAMEIEEDIGLDAESAIPVSAKTGINIDKILDAVVRDLPPPIGKPDDPPRALIFDSWYDSYRGVTVLMRVVDGSFKVRDKIQLCSTGKTFEIQSLGVFTPQPKDVKVLNCGEVGFLTASIKDVKETQIGDTVANFISKIVTGA